VRTKLVAEIRKALTGFAPALIAEHGKDLQHAPGVNPSSGFPKATVHPQTKADTTAAKTTTTKTGNAVVNTTTVTASDEFRTTAGELYSTFTDPQRITAFTRGAPRQFDGAKVGGKFAIFDGNVTGEFVTLNEPKQIVQKWRLAQWPEGHFSTQEINFDQNDIDGVTQMRVSWSGVPVGQEDVTKQNWDMYYVRSIKQTFGYVFFSFIIPCLSHLSFLHISFGLPIPPFFWTALPIRCLQISAFPSNLAILESVTNHTRSSPWCRFGTIL
jgi:activator of HSP90 ATPase